MAARITLQSYLKAPKTASLAKGIKNTRTIATFKVPAVNNEPNPTYSRGTVDREKLAAALKSFRQQAPVDVPVVIAGKTISNQTKLSQSDPSAHTNSVASYSNASSQDVSAAIDAALAAKPAWENLPFADRAAVFLKAADLIAGKYRYDIMAATMAGQGKNAYQAEIDAAAELCDFLRFNVQ
ncbi:delta-1-pyrroline-5-carboxylate dehydrogenase 1, partial [Aureobasidium melanogenum]